MNRIVILLIASFALVNCQNNVSTNGTSTATTTNLTTTESTANATTAATTLTTNGTSEPTTQNVTTPVPTAASTPTPTTPPKPSEWNGTVTKDNNTCINVKFAVEIKIKYNNTNNTEVTTGFNIPVDARVDEKNSYCSSPNSSQLEVLVIRFDNEEYTSANLTLRFNETSDNVFVQQIELSYILTRELFPSYNNPGHYNTEVTMKSKTGLSLFSVAKVHSYVCDKAQTAPLEDAGSKTNGAEIEFTESKVQAFIDKTKNGKFDSEINCKSTEISDVVPIAVGAALAGLVVIVLIAYFIGRRRSRRLAYQSV